VNVLASAANSAGTTQKLLTQLNTQIKIVIKSDNGEQKEDAMHLVAAIVLAAIILYYLRTMVVALNSAQHHYTAFTLVLIVAVVCIAILERYSAA
jgi:uncharacterized membrane protein